MTKEKTFCSLEDGISGNIYHVIVHDYDEGTTFTIRHVYAKVPSWLEEIDFSEFTKFKSKQAKELEELFGEDYMRVLGVKYLEHEDGLVIHNEPLFPDDNIEDVYHRICKANGWKYVYMWCKRRVSDQQVMKRAFLRSIYKNRLFLPRSEIAQYLQYLTGKDLLDITNNSPLNLAEASALLQDVKIKHLNEPLRFKYFQNDAFAFYPIDPTKLGKKDHVKLNADFFDIVLDLSLIHI